jgi:ABC-2 type transport system permease protein
MTTLLNPTADGRLVVPRSRRAISVVAHQLRFDLLSMTRNRQARFFTMAMPVSFLLLFCAIFGNGLLKSGGERIHASTYYVASITTFAIVDVAFMSLVIGLIEIRENGILRRRQATPQPTWSIVASRALTCIVMSLGTAAVLLLIGRLAFGAQTPLAALPPLIAAVAVGSVASCFLGFAVTGFVRSQQSAQPIAMALAMPLFFISGVFVPWPFIPHWLQQVAGIFPLRDLTLAIQYPITTHSGSVPWSGGDLGLVALWGLVGLVVALRSFKWAPQDV